MPKKLFQFVLLSLCYLIGMDTIVVADYNNCVTVNVYTAEGSKPISYYYTPCSCGYTDPKSCYPDTARPGNGIVAITTTAYPGGIINPGPQDTSGEFPDNYPILNKLTEYCCDSRTQKCTPGKCAKSKKKNIEKVKK